MRANPRLLVPALMSALFLLSACQAPANRRPSPWGLKTIHPPTGHCGHFPKAEAHTTGPR